MSQTAKQFYSRYHGKQTKKKRPEERMYRAGDNWDFTWTQQEIRDVISMWQAGISLADMAAYFSRKQVELTVLIMDLAEQKRLKPRDGGVFGSL